MTFSQNLQYISIILNVKVSVLESYSWHAILQTQRKGDAVDSNRKLYVETEIKYSSAMFIINDNPGTVGTVITESEVNKSPGVVKKWHQCDRWPRICLLKCLS